MNKPKPSITVNVDVTNPGQFFACCGLLELADRLWPGAEGWFEAGTFCIRSVDCNCTATVLAIAIEQCSLQSTMSGEQTARLKTLKNLNKKLRNEETERETQKLSALWENERLGFTVRSTVWLDWWNDDLTDAASLKTWAGKQLISEIAGGLHGSVKRLGLSSIPSADWLQPMTRDGGLPLYLDSDVGNCSSSLDVGFSMDAIDMRSSIRPTIELFAFIGLQRFRPAMLERKARYAYSTWSTPLEVVVATPVCGGLMPKLVHETFEFRLFYRTKYLKSFLHAVPITQGVDR